MEYEVRFYFAREELEKLYYFESKNRHKSVMIISSKVLNTIVNGSIFLKVKVHV